MLSPHGGTAVDEKRHSRVLLMKRLSLVLLVIVSSGTFGRTAPGDPAVSLSEFFKPGVVFQDRNGDGAVDFVNARIVLPENPTATELSAAADVAARLGFETSAMDLPVVRRKPDTTAANATSPIVSGVNPTGASTRVSIVSGFSRTAPAIFIGARSLTGTGVTPSALGGATLRAGEG